MIIGLIMLIAAITGFLVYNRIKTAKIEEEAKKIADLGLQAEEIEKFVNDCIRKAGFEGLRRLGETGGYLDVPNLISFKGVGAWYLDETNIQPFLNQTQERLIEYVNVNIPKCIEEGNLSKFGFLVEKGHIFTSIEFGARDVAIKVDYPIKLSKEKFVKQFSEFFNIFDIRYRSIFEAATEVNEKLFDADFDINEPLKKLGYLRNLDFEVAYKTPETDIMIFTITDKKSITPTNELYTFSFAAKFGNSTLKKVIDLQDNSASNPTFLPYTIYSVDKKAQLEISEGTTINLNGSDVSSISVQQAYPNEVTTKDVPVYKKNDQIMQRQDIKYVIDNSIYTFEPSGILFNKFQKLTIYYPPDANDAKGVGILMGKQGFWVPIPSKHEPEQKRVFSSILGFTEFTAVNCASQELKRTIAEHFFKPKSPCYVLLALRVITTLTIIVTVIGTGFSITSFMGGSILTGLTLVTLTGSILGATTDIFYEKSPDNCQTFYPMCDQTITIQKEEKDGKGKCIPSGSTNASAGQPINICAQIKKCDRLKKYLCKPCSVKCTASFY